MRIASGPVRPHVCWLVAPFAWLWLATLAAVADTRLVTHSEAPNAEGAIFLIHGLWGDPEATFMDEGSGVYWPDLMRRDARPLGAAKPLSAYSIYVLKHAAAERGPPFALEEIVQEVVDQIRRLNRNTQPRRIILVAHSLGGIIAKRVFVDSEPIEQRKLRAIFLFAVPSNGVQLGWARHILIFFSRQIAELQEQRDNNWLLQNENRYKQQYNDRVAGRLPRVYCAMEGVPTRSSMLPVPVQILDWNDVNTYCDNGNPKKFERDHITIVKPTGRNDLVYDWFREMLTETLAVPEPPAPPSQTSEETDFEIARKADTVAALKAYVAKHPSGKFQFQADARIKELEANDASIEARRKEEERQRSAEEKVFKDAQNANTVVALKDYVRLYPAGRFVTQAHSRIKELETAALDQQKAAAAAGPEATSSQQSSALEAMLIWTGYLDAEVSRTQRADFEKAMKRVQQATGSMTPDGKISQSQYAALRERFLAARASWQFRRVHDPKAGELWLPRKLLPDGEDLRFGRRYKSSDGDFSVDVAQLSTAEFTLDGLREFHCCKPASRKLEGPIVPHTESSAGGDRLLVQRPGGRQAHKLPCLPERESGSSLSDYL